MLRVHICLHLEDESGHFLGRRIYLALGTGLRTGRRCVGSDGGNEFDNAEFFQSGSEIDRGQITVLKCGQVELGIACLRKFGFFPQARRTCSRQNIVEAGGVKAAVGAYLALKSFAVSRWLA